MIIEDHVLAEDDQLDVNHQTPNTSGEFAAGHPNSIVIHFTAGSSALSSVKHLCKPSAKASAHIVIGRDGKIYQLAPFNMITWHAGRSSWQGKTGLNKYAIGIELDNAGELNDNGNGQYLSWFNKAYTGEDVFFGRHRNQRHEKYWHAYTQKQIERTFTLCERLCERYGIQDILGHEEIAPNRKVDPGPAFPLDRLRNQLLSDARNSDLPAFARPQRALVSADKLNIRSGPGAHYAKVAQPLTRGAAVKPLNTQEGWVEVEYTVKGWVSGQYLKTLGPQ